MKTFTQTHQPFAQTPQKSQAGAKVDLHAAACGNLPPISEPSDLGPREAVYSWCMDESSLALGYSLRSLPLHKTSHI